MELNYPDELIRGIANRDYIDNEERASASMFQFDDSIRLDGFQELSINWYDDENALKQTLNQRKKSDENEYQFKAGAAILSRSRLDSLIHSPYTKGALTYERRIVEGNPYHGNILLKSSITKQIKRVFSASLAMCIEKIVYR